MTPIMIAATVVAVILLVLLTVWKSRTPSRSEAGMPEEGAGPGGHGGPAGRDRFGNGFGGNWGG